MKKRRNSQKEDAAARKRRTAKATARSTALRNSKAERSRREELKETVMELRAEGLTLDAIAQRLGLSKGGAVKLYMERLQERRKVNDQYRDQHILKMEHETGALMDKLFSLALNGRIKVVEERVNSKGEVEMMELAEFEKVIKTTASWSKLAERLARLLGLDAGADKENGKEGVNVVESIRRLVSVSKAEA